jgi:magnesium chelatase subunit D
VTGAPTALALLAVDPVGLGGVVLRGGVTPGRDLLLAGFTGLLPAPERIRRVPAGVDAERLTGGLDLVATLATGRPVVEPGLLAVADGGALIVPMAERLGAGVVGVLGQALDEQAVRIERDGLSVLVPCRVPLVLLDEAEPDEPGVAASLVDRLAFAVQVEPGWREESPDWPGVEAVRAAAATVAAVTLAPARLRSLAEVATAFGVVGQRPLILAARAARAHAALHGRLEAADEDLTAAVALVIAPRAVVMPDLSEEESPPADTPDPQEPADPSERDPNDEGPLEDRMIAAARAAIPEDVLRAMAGERGSRSGRQGAAETPGSRGRRTGVRKGRPGGNRRVDVLPTIRAAAPWQRLRGQELPVRRLQIRGDDFHVQRRVRPLGTTTIVLVDASGSTALYRLGEAKGAVELLLAASYQRRDEVALIVFRGSAADLVLPPTRALARAKRALAGLPGGGGTPLAAAIDLATALVERVRRGGAAPAVVLLTDGKANITRAGTPDRTVARAEAAAAATRFRATGVAATWLDIGPRPTAIAREFAALMGARYAPLPTADAAGIATLADATRDEARRAG